MQDNRLKFKFIEKFAKTSGGDEVDKKFEGFSNLKGKSERQEKKASRLMNAKVSDDLDI